MKIENWFRDKRVLKKAVKIERILSEFNIMAMQGEFTKKDIKYLERIIYNANVVIDNTKTD